MPPTTTVKVAGPAEAVHLMLSLDADDIDYTVMNNHMASALAIQVGEQIVTGKWISVSPS